jgi:hypothetical protein
LSLNSGAHPYVLVTDFFKAEVRLFFIPNLFEGESISPLVSLDSAGELGTVGIFLSKVTPYLEALPESLRVKRDLKTSRYDEQKCAFFMLLIGSSQSLTNSYFFIGLFKPSSSVTS